MGERRKSILREDFYGKLKRELCVTGVACCVALSVFLIGPISVQATEQAKNEISEKEYRRRFKAALAQAEGGSQETKAIIAAEFRDKKLYYGQRKRALGVLMKGDVKPFEEIFESALKDRWEVAVVAAKGLFRIGNPKGRQWLLERVDSGYRSFPNKAILRVVSGLRLVEAIPNLKKWLISTDRKSYHESEIRVKKTDIAIALARMGVKEGIEFLRQNLLEYEKNSADYTGLAAICLGKIGDVNSIPVLEYALNTKSTRDKLKVAEALLILERETPIPLLLQVVESGGQFGIESAELLKNYRIKEGIPALEAFFEKELDKKEFLRKEPLHPWIERELKEAKVSREYYINHQYGDSFWMRVRIAVWLVELGSNKGKESVITLLRNPEEEANERKSWKMLLQAISEHRIIEAIPALEARFEKELNRKEFLREQVVRSPWIQKKLKEENVSPEYYVNGSYRERFWKRVRIAVCLVEVGSSKGRESVIALLRNPGEASRSGWLWEPLLQTVAEHKIVEAIPHLLSYLDLPNEPMLRKKSLKCLQRLTGIETPMKREEWQTWYENHKGSDFTSEPNGA